MGSVGEGRGGTVGGFVSRGGEVWFKSVYITSGLLILFCLSGVVVLSLVTGIWLFVLVCFIRIRGGLTGFISNALYRTL